MKKIYLKPDAAVVCFYSEEEIADILDKNAFAGIVTTSDITGEMGSADVNNDWT
jgi:hypothetical protein